MLYTSNLELFCRYRKLEQYKLRSLWRWSDTPTWCTSVPLYISCPSHCVSPCQLTIFGRLFLIFLDSGQQFSTISKIMPAAVMFTLSWLEVHYFWHILQYWEEQVTGELLDELSSWDALRAALPVGTVSGAPKVSAILSQQLIFMSVSIHTVQN